MQNLAILFDDFFPEASDRNIMKFKAPLLDAMQEFEINTPLRVAAFLANIAVESGNLYYVEEIASGSAYEYREDLGNLEFEALQIAHANYSTTGKFYKGHGLIQITGYYNHKKCGEALDLDLVHHPKLLCEPVNAARSAAWFFKTHGCNELADVKAFSKIVKRIKGAYNPEKDKIRDENYAYNKQILFNNVA